MHFYGLLAECRDAGWIGALLLCGLVYGGTDFSVARGVWDAVRGRPRAWKPTNAAVPSDHRAALLAEACFGAVLLSGPLLNTPALLYLPCSYLFAGKFLFGPALSLLYQDDEHHELSPAPTIVDPGRRSAIGMDCG